MSQLYQMQWRLRSPLRTPLSNDVLAGTCAWAYQALYGDAKLAQWLKEFASVDPPLVFSNGWLAGTLPRPLWFNQPRREAKSKSERLTLFRQAKREKSQHEVSVSTFLSMTQGTYGQESTEKEDIPVVPSWKAVEHTHTSVNRQTGSALDESLHVLSSQMSAVDVDIYVRAQDGALLQTLFRFIQQTGFGGGVSRGYGQFEVLSIEPLKWPEIHHANAEVWLGSGVPLATYSTVGKYRVKIKYGKVGNGFFTTSPWKYPLVMLEPGSTFELSSPWRGYAGQMISRIAENPAVQHFGLVLTAPARISSYE